MGEFKQFSRNFSTRDFPVGEPHPILIRKLQYARYLYRKPMIITSGGRTPEHNADVGGVSDSSHLIREDGFFQGCDIRCQAGGDRYLMLVALLEAGFKRIGIYDKHIHIDVDEDKPSKVIWVSLSK